MRLQERLNVQPERHHGISTGTGSELRRQLLIPRPWLFTLATASLVSLLCLPAGMAKAQTSGSVAIVSDYVYRGISLTNDKPALQFNLVYDAPQGWYGGLFATQMAASDNQTRIRYIAYGGYSQTLPSGLNWELGANQFLMPQDSSTNYSEVYAGLGFERLSAKIHYSPNYLRANNKNIYLDLGATYPVTDMLDAFVHIGFSRLLPATIYDNRATRCDAMLGLNLHQAEWTLRLGRTVQCGNQKTANPYATAFQAATVLSIIRAF